MLRRFNKVGYAKFFSDLLLIVLCFVVASWLSHRGIDKVDRLILAAYLVGWYFSTKITNAYNDFRTETYVGELLIILQNILVQMVIAGQLYFILNEHAYARTFVLWYMGLLTVFLVLKGYVTKKLLLLYRQYGGNTRAILFIGYNEITEGLIETIQKSPHFGYRVVGVVCKEEMPNKNFTYLGDLKKFFEQSGDVRIDDVFITSDKVDKESLQQILNYTESKAIRTKIIPNYHNFPQKRFHLSVFGDYPLIAMRGEPLQDWQWRALKRAFDIVFSFLVITLIFSWLFPIIALLIKLDSKGPVFFIQERWGENGKMFRCFKFRSMKATSEKPEHGKYQQATKNDPRVTKLGAFLRKSSIDELPQFINVLLGDMSVVGPRPHPHRLNIESANVVEKYKIRHWTKPGITGWAQVNGYRGETKTNDMMQKRINLDIWYIENWSFLLDIRIVLMTIYNSAKGEEMAY